MNLMKALACRTLASLSDTMLGNFLLKSFVGGSTHKNQMHEIYFATNYYVYGILLCVHILHVPASRSSMLTTRSLLLDHL